MALHPFMTEAEMQEIFANPIYATAQQRCDAMDVVNERNKLAADDGIITPEQQIYIDWMIETNNMEQSYLRAYPACSKLEANNYAKKLMNRPSILAPINKGRMLLLDHRDKLLRKAKIDAINRLKDQRGILQAIITGELMKKDTTWDSKNGITAKKFKEDPNILSNAIKLDRKLEEEWNVLLVDLRNDIPLLETMIDLEYRDDPEYYDAVGYRPVHQEAPERPQPMPTANTATAQAPAATPPPPPQAPVAPPQPRSAQEGFGQPGMPGWKPTAEEFTKFLFDEGYEE